MAYINEQQIRFDDVDGAGIVYYPRFFHFCHKAFEDFFNQGPFSYPELICQRKIGFPTVHIEADFKKPLFYGDRISISLSLQKIGNASVSTKYEFFRTGEDILYFVCDITLVCMNLEQRCAQEIPQDIRAFLAQFLQ
jgi:4-hydroxybenzoyl-CoA thioesterase